jgi:tetratricopeptide (TPR) repeat protein
VNKIVFLLFTSIFYHSVFAQQDGYWDKDRATTKEITVAARDRIVIMTDDFPIGTTELIYRITLLDDNQKMASSLVSVLKSIPDPTGISQGAAGTVFLLSRISGEDKCRYAIFSSNDGAVAYQKNGKIDQACLAQETPLSKDARRLSMDKSACLKNTSANLWFGFESSNWVMKQKIILEVVPWVDTKFSRGWSLENRKFVINQCKTSPLARKLANSDDFCICVEEKIQKQYKFQEFQKLLSIEQAKVYKDGGESCINETSVSKGIYNDLRNKALELARKAQYGDVIEPYVRIISDGKATALDYGNIGFAYIMTKQYAKAIKLLQQGAKLDDTELVVKLNLAHAYLLNKEWRNAKSIYKQYQFQNVADSISWGQKIKQDFSTFKKAGIESEDFEKVLKLLAN